MVVKLPDLSQIILGGESFTRLKSTKSESKVTIAYPFFFAKLKIFKSGAFSNPSKRTCVEPGNFSSKSLTILDDMF